MAIGGRDSDVTSGRFHARSPISDALFAVLAETSGGAGEVLPKLLAVIARGLGFEIATMWWWRPDEGVLRCEQAWQAPGAGFDAFVESALGSVLAAGEPIPGAVYLTGEPLSVPRLAEQASFRRRLAAARAGLTSGFAFPIRARGEIVGVFELFSAGLRVPDEPLFAAVADAAARLGDFIERLNLQAEQARLLASLAAAQRRHDFLSKANRALSMTKGLDATIERLAAVAVPAIGDLCLVDVVNARGAIERLAARHAELARQPLADELRTYPPDPGGDHPAAVVMRTGRSLTAQEMPGGFMSATTRSDLHLELTQQLGFTSYMSAPLLAGKVPIGALTIVSAGSGRRFDEEDLALMEELAAQVASVIERERRYDEQHQVAHALQRSMLPERLDEIEGLRSAAHYVASNEATEVGGDFYDLVRLDASRAALVVGDVEGHDLVATTVMANVRSALRAYLEVSDRPEEVVAMLDRYVRNQVRTRMVTLVLGVLEPGSGALELVSAGHPAPLRFGDPVEPVACVTGPPIGLGSDGYRASRLVVPAGSGLALYTDGLVEHRRAGPAARFGRLVAALADLETDDLDQGCAQVIRRTMAGEEPTDDVALLLVLRSPG